MRNIDLELLIPYATYEVRYQITNFDELDETNALILLAIVSNNKNSHQTDSLKDVLIHFYKINVNFLPLFEDEIKYLLATKTIANNEDKNPTMDSTVGNFIVDKKVMDFLDNGTGYFGNTKNTKAKSLDLKINLLQPNNYEECSLASDNNLVSYNSRQCLEFEVKNEETWNSNQDDKDNKIYLKKIQEYLNNKLHDNENLFSFSFANQDEINQNINLIYTRTPCSFFINLEDNKIDIAGNDKLADIICTKYYKEHIFYVDLLKMICTKISTKFIKFPITTTISSESNILKSDDLIDENKLVYLDNKVYYVADNEIWELTIYQREISDNFNYHETLNSLTYQVLSEDGTKNLIKNNINESSQLNKIYLYSTNESIKDYLLENICQNESTITKYKDLINDNFDKCMNYLIANKIWIEFIYQNFGEELTTNYLTEIVPTDAKESLLKELATKQIYSPELELLLINFLNFDYSTGQTYLVKSELEQKIIQVINKTNDVIREADTFDENNLFQTYTKINETLDGIDSLIKDKKVRIKCLDDLKKILRRKLDDVRSQLGEHNIEKLRGIGGQNRDILEGDIWNLIAPKRQYDSKSFKEIGEYCQKNIILKENEINDFIEMQKFNNGIMHKQNDKDLKFIEPKEYNEAENKLKKYQDFLMNLKIKISNWKKNNSYKEVSKEKEGK